MTAGETYYVRIISSVSSPDYEFEVTIGDEVEYSPFPNATVITSTGSYTAYISQSGERHYFKFVAPTSGNYQFYASSSADTKGYLYNSQGSLLKDDDDSGSGNNFSFTYYLNAGETYYFGAGFWSSYTGSYTVYLTAN